MKNILRRMRRRTASHEASNAKKENANEQSFFGEAAAEHFFQPAAVQRKCAGCEKEEKLQKQEEKKEEKLQKKEDQKDEEKLMKKEEKDEEKVHKKEATATSVSSGGISNYVHSLNGKGHSLSADTNQFYSTKMGYDFSNVKVHTDQQAAQSAKDVNAKAYTVGNNIVFNKGQYNIESNEGKKLMAHELAHVVQQNQDVSCKLQRRTQAGFEIEGLYPDAASHPETIFYEKDSAVIPSSEWYKLSGIAGTFSGSNITLTGSASEEGDPATNATITNTRIAGVDRMLGRLRHTGLRTPNPQPTASAGNIDYRQARNVEVILTPGTIPPGGIMPTTSPPCAATVTNPTPEVEPCGAAFISSFPQAILWALSAYAQVASSSPTALAQVALLFPGIPPATISGHLLNLIGQLGRLPSQHRCHNTCDGGCGRPAYNSGTGSSSMMTLCPDFLTSTDHNGNAQTLIHESLHATPGLATVDTAYSTTRLVQNLTGAQALNNTDSYVLLILRLAGVSPIPGPATDTVSSLSLAEQVHTNRALALLEQWLLNADFDTGLIYSAMDRNIGSSTGWASGDAFEAGNTHDMHAFVGLTDPGTAPFPNAPVQADKTKMAGMWDRYNPMMRAVYMRNITVTTTAPGTDMWAPGMGANVNVSGGFFAMSAEDSVKHLLRLLVVSQGRVPSAVVDAYVEAANSIRKNRSTGP